MGGQPADLVVWATGEVDAALRVRPVDAVPRKLQLSAELFRGLAAAKTPVLVLVPREAEAAARAALAELQPADTRRLVPVGTADEAFSQIAPPPQQNRQTPAPVPAPAPAPMPQPGPRPRRRSGRRWLWAAAVLPILAAAAATLAAAESWREPFSAWQQLADAGEYPKLQSALAATEAMPHCLTCAAVAALFRDRLAAAQPSPSSIHVEVTEIRHDRFGDCQDADQLKAQPVPRAADGSFAPSSAAGLCEVRYSASGAPHVALVLSSGSADAGGPVQTTDIGVKRAQVTAIVPLLLQAPIDNRLIVVAAAGPLEPLLAAASHQEGGGEVPPDQLRQQLAAPAVLVFEVRHSIVP